MYCTIVLYRYLQTILVQLTTYCAIGAETNPSAVMTGKVASLGDVSVRCDSGYLGPALAKTHHDGHTITLLLLGELSCIRTSLVQFISFSYFVMWENGQRSLCGLALMKTQHDGDDTILMLLGEVQ